MIERKFNSLDELLKHLSGVMAEAEAAEAAAQQDAESTEIDDWELRRHVIAYVTDKIEFSSPEEFKQYVEFVYEFMATASE